MKVGIVCANGKAGRLIAKEAVAMVDEITKGNHIQERISVVRK